MAFVTKKVHEEIDVVIKFIQAMLQLEKGERIPEAKVIDIAIFHYAREKYGYKIRSKHKLDDIIKISKSKVKSSAKEIDETVYGA